MEYRPLGRTGLSVSNLSFGASSLGSVFRRVDEDEAIRTVHTALDLGMNLIDVSPFYGLTKAETVLGQALAGIDRTRFILSTKAGRYGQTDFDFSRDRILRSVEESLNRLGLDYIDILHLHDIEFGDQHQILNESIPTLYELKDEGTIHFHGITGLPLAIYPQVLEHTPVDTIISYCHYCLNDTSLLDRMPYFNEKGVGVINASPLAMGLLTPRGAPDWHPAPAVIKEKCSQAAEYCKERGASLPKLAVQFAAADPAIPTTLVGTANPDNIRRNAAWIDEPIDTGLLAAVQEILAPIHNQTWPSGTE